MRMPAAAHDPACPASLPEVGCPHLGACRLTLRQENVHTDFATFLATVYSQRTCPLVLQKLQTVIAEVGAVIDASYDRWSEVGWELSAEAFMQSAQKRCRLSEKVTSHVINNTVAQGRFQTASSASRAMDHITKSQCQRVLQREVAALRQSMLKQSAGQQCVALATDASRVGKPKEDVLLGAISFPKIYVHGCTVAQVPGMGSVGSQEGKKSEVFFSCS